MHREDLPSYLSCNLIQLFRARLTVPYRTLGVNSDLEEENAYQEILVRILPNKSDLLTKLHDSVRQFVKWPSLGS